MALFPDEVIVSVATSVTPLILEGRDPIEDAVLNAVLNDNNIAENLAKTYLGGIHISADRFYTYGRDRYVNGLPEGATRYASIDYAALKAAVTDVAQEPITLSIALLTEPDPTIFAQEYMQDNQGWDSSTNIVHDGPIPNDEDYPTTFKSATISEGNVHITYAYSRVATVGGRPVGGAVEKTTMNTYPIAKLRLGDLYYHVEYTLDSDTTGYVYTWVYDPNSGTYPTLVADPYTAQGSPYYPIVPFRSNGVNLTDVEDPASDLYRTTKEALRINTIDLETITDQVMTNPDVQFVDDAFITYSANVLTEDPFTLQYLYAYFADLSLSSIQGEADFLTYKALIDGGAKIENPINSIVISDLEYNSTFAYNYIKIATVLGNVGDIGSVTTTHTIAAPTKVTSGSIRVGVKTVAYFENSYIVYRKQVSATEYSELTLHGPTLYTKIAERNGSDYSAIRTVASGLTDASFSLPLNRDILLSLELEVQQKTLYATLSLVIYAVQETHVRWYASSTFLSLVKFVGIFMAIYTLGTSYLAYAALYGYAVAFLIVVLEIVAVSFVVDLIAEAVVDLLGDDAALVLAVLSVVAAVFAQGYGTTGLLSAETMLLAASTLTRGLQINVQEDLISIQNESDRFLEDAAEKQEELDAANDLLGSTDINLFNIVSTVAYNNPNITPDQYYYVANDLTNPGVVTLGAIESFVDNLLEVPDPEHNFNLTL